MSCSNKEQNSKAISRKISFSEIPIKDNVNLFQSNEMPHSSSTNYQNFQQSNIHSNKDQYFNFNLKTLPTDSIEDINMNKSRLVLYQLISLLVTTLELKIRLLSLVRKICIKLHLLI